MKRTIKSVMSLVLIALIFCSTGLAVFAWTKPNIKTDYVEPDEEFRAVWVCTVSNMDVKPQNGVNDAAINAWKERYLTILDNSIKQGMNAIIFQVSPCNDAFYPSKYKPWSTYLAGFGVDPGWDPVEWMIEVTHEAGLEYHAWFNPYRTSASALSYDITQTDPATSSEYIYDYDQDALYAYKQEYFGNLKDICKQNDTLVDNPIFKTGNDLDYNVVYGAEGKFVLNPASESTIKHLENTIDEFVTNYDADGIHFDDYFYPNDTSYKGSDPTYKKDTFSTEPKIDLADYNDYVAGGGELNLYDWRRENVNNLIERLSNIIRAHNQTKEIKCAFGISPSARWAPKPENCPVGSTRPAEGGMNGNCNDYYSYSDLSADTRKWVKEGWLDYILPQIYVNLGSSMAGVPTGNYNSLNQWWSETIEGTNCKLYIGTGLYQMNSWVGSGDAQSTEIYYQIRWNQYKKYNVDGYVMFRYASFFDTQGSLAMKTVNANLWKMAALTPLYDSYEYEGIDTYATIKKLKYDPSGLYTAEINKVDGAKAYGITEDGKVIARVLAGKDEIQFSAEEGKTYALVTYGYDNQIYETVDVVDFSTVEVNEAPVITFNSTLKDTYLTLSKIDVSFTVSDTENDSLTYKLYCKEGTTIYNLITECALTTDTVTYTYECLAIPMKDVIFVLEVKDPYQTTVFESTSFNVVKEQTPQPPVHEHEFIDGECECGEIDPNYQQQNPNPPSTGATCSMGSYGLLGVTLSIVALFSVVLRKRD